MTFKVLTARRVTLGQIRVGAVATAVTWQALQLAATLLLGHKLKGATATYGLFALILDLRRRLRLVAGIPSPRRHRPFRGRQLEPVRRRN
jgi:hypothetical protein